VARDRMMLLRLDPAALRFDVGYGPGAPRDLVGWQAETGALVVVNGGFFTESYDATGLVVSGGRTHGASYEAFGGMFAVTADGPEVRALGARPHDPAEPLVAALQAFPMLVASSAAAGFDDPAARPARRTWVGQDRAGRIVVGVAPEGGLTLRALADWLAASDLALDAALNLDGGASSGLLLAEPRELVPAFDVLPTVILAFEREG